MTEFEFLDAQFRRLTEARGLRYRHEKSGTLKKDHHSEFETAELMIEGAIKDYLKLRNTKGDE